MNATVASDQRGKFNYCRDLSRLREPTFTTVPLNESGNSRVPCETTIPHGGRL
jgi:hypothetical protein